VWRNGMDRALVVHSSAVRLFQIAAALLQCILHGLHWRSEGAQPDMSCRCGREHRRNEWETLSGEYDRPQRSAYRRRLGYAFMQCQSLSERENRSWLEGTQHQPQCIDPFLLPIPP
jgi:hypothetical protein